MTPNGTWLLHVHCTCTSIVDVLGSYNANIVEKLPLDFIQYILRVKRNITSAMFYFETGRLPMEIVRIFCIFKFGWSCYIFLLDDCEKFTKPRNNWVANNEGFFHDNDLGFFSDMNKIQCTCFTLCDKNMCLLVVKPKQKKPKQTKDKKPTKCHGWS